MLHGRGNGDGSQQVILLNEDIVEVVERGSMFSGARPSIDKILDAIVLEVGSSIAVHYERNARNGDGARNYARGSRLSAKHADLLEGAVVVNNETRDALGDTRCPRRRRCRRYPCAA